MEIVSTQTGTADVVTMDRKESCLKHDDLVVTTGGMLVMTLFMIVSSL